MYEKGHILIGGWEIDGTLGEGSYGVVYRAKRTVVNKTEWAAIKHIPVPASAAELNAIYAELGSRDVNEVNEYLTTVKDALVSEYHQMREFQGHTNIVACNDISIIDRKDSPGYDIFIRMELLTSLSNQIMDGKMDRKQTIRLGLDVCRALTLLSSKGIVHRDIKPQNIFVNENGDYKLGDFGTARSIKGTSTMMSMKGTFAFMAPEIMMGKPANFTTDIYSLGLVMYRLMNGNKAPFMQPGQASTASSIDAANTRRFRGEELPLPAEADETLGKIICKACAFESWNRWQSADELYNALCDMAEGTIRRDPPLEPNPEGEKARADAEREKAKREQEKKEKEEKEQARLKQEKKKKGIKSLGIIIACAVTLVAGVIGMQEIGRSSVYEEAVQAMSVGRLEEAKEGFAKLGDYRDATEKAEYITKEQERQQKYTKAEELMQQEDYLGAIVIYNELGDYKDSKAKLKQAEGRVTENERKAQYNQAKALETEGKYEEAMTIYAALGEYSDATYRHADLKAKIENYKTAQLRESMEEYDKAESYYTAAGKYKDAEAKAKEMKNWQLYVEAQEHMDNGEYKKAFVIYKKLSSEQFQNAEKLLSIPIGNTVLFGNYEQDGNPNNGSEPIEWYIMDYDEQGILLISRYSLDAVPFHQTNTAVSWETSTLRAWLNSDFLTTAFSPYELEHVVDSCIPPVGDMSSAFETVLDPGNSTIDKVFLLSRNEWYEEHYRRVSSKAPKTVYASRKDPENRHDDLWWLRGEVYDKQSDYPYSCLSVSNGYTPTRFPVTTNVVGVRPLVRVDTTKVLTPAENTND